MSDETKIPLPDLDGNADVVPRMDEASLEPEGAEDSRNAADLEAVFDVPVPFSAAPKWTSATC
jgi:hypothetical protein